MGTSGITKWMGGWVGEGAGGEGRGRANHQDVNITFFELYEFIFKFSPLKTVCLPRCRFQTLHVVATGHEASMAARVSSSQNIPVCSLYTPVYSR